jgi:hypothetical protein
MSIFDAVDKRNACMSLAKRLPKRLIYCTIGLDLLQNLQKT